MGKENFPLAAGSASRRIASFVSYIATVVEVAVDKKGNLTVPRGRYPRSTCGFLLANPERIRSQNRKARP